MTKQPHGELLLLYPSPPSPFMLAYTSILPVPYSSSSSLRTNTEYPSCLSTTILLICVLFLPPISPPLWSIPYTTDSVPTEIMPMYLSLNTKKYPSMSLIPHRLPSKIQIPWETIRYSKSKYFNALLYFPFEQKSVIYCFITKVYSKMKNKNIVVGIAVLNFEPMFHCYL